MNLDFHYYATYVAACFVGYKEKDAQIIAHAAQYVDDSILDQIDPKLLPGLQPIPTSHSFLVFVSNRDWDEAFYDEVLRVWPVFHFLPGNYDNDGKYREKHDKLESDINNFSAWHFDDEAKEQFKLMCLPNSKLAESMINDLIGNSSLIEIGLRMHVLADTWAHMYYVGVPAWFINGTTDFTKHLGDKDTPNIDSIQSKYHNSILYLGHPQSEHWPDYASYSFSCKFPWRNKHIQKENVPDYLKAIKQLMNALYCIKNKIHFNIHEEKLLLSKKNEKMIQGILSTTTTTYDAGEILDQTEIWKANITQIEVGGEKLQIPVDYNLKEWIDKAKIVSEDKKQTTEYYIFNAAAIKQLKYVKDEPKKASIYLDDIPDNRIVEIYPKDTEKRYVSIAENSYPTLSTDEKKRVLLELILHNDAPLSHGTIVEIRTTEKKYKKDFKYLGAWNDTYLYYYTKKSNPSCQKWKIMQGEAVVGTPIDMSKPVELLNVFYSSQTYMKSLKGWGEEYYLTTATDPYSFTIIPAK